MHQNKFYYLFNRVLSLIIDKRLREDIDDTLLEKLLHVLKEGTSSESFIYELQKRTKVLILFDKALSDLLKKSKKLPSAMAVFSLKLFGYMLQNKKIFTELKNSRMTIDLSELPKHSIFATCSPSVQDAVISALICIATHSEGSLWLIEHEFIDFVFSSFSSKSYYVKKTAAKFLTSSIVLWSSSEFSESLDELQKSILIKAMQSIVSKLISGIQSPNDSETENFCKYCVLTLNQLFLSETKLPHIHLPLIEAIVNYFKKINKDHKINQDVVELLCTAEKRYHSDVTIIREIIHILVEKWKLTDAFYLASSFLGLDRHRHLCSSGRLSFFLMPFDVLENNIPSNYEEEIFLLSSDTVYRILIEEMKMKAKGVSLITSSLSALSRLTPFMQKRDIESVIASVRVIFLQDPGNKEIHFLSSLCLENRKICLALLDLFSALLSEEIYKCSISNESKLLLFNYFIKTLKNPSTDCNIASEALRLLKSFVALNAQYKFEFNDEIKDEFVALICRKLCENKEPIVDSALHLAGEIINGEDHALWMEVVLKNSLHTIVWDIAIEGNHDGIIKASALNVITLTCSHGCYFDNIQSMKKVSKVDIMNILCNYVFDDDFFIQREAVLSASKWMQLNYAILPSSCKDNLFLIFSSAIRSLDLDLKLAALKEWQCFVNDEKFFSQLSETNINSCLAEYCSSGYGSSLLYALEDYDEAVKYKAATVMLELREKLIAKDITKDFITQDTAISENISKPDIADSFAAISVTKEERNKGIDNVMELSTAEQILNICKTTESNMQNLTVPELELENLSCSVKSFWSSLWSNKLNVIVKLDEESTLVFSENSLSLLEDIIAAERTELINSIDDTPDCY